MPLSWLIGLYSFKFPLSILWLPGSLYTKIMCIGLDHKLIAEKQKAFLARVEQEVGKGMDINEAWDQVDKNDSHSPH